MKKTLAAALLAILAVSSLSFAVASASAMSPSNHGWGWSMGGWRNNGGVIPFQRSWVRLNGIVEEVSVGGAFQQITGGSLSVNARTISAEEDAIKKAFANVIWRTESDTTIKTDDGWSTSFYAARLVDAEVSILGSVGEELNVEVVADYTLTGTWKMAHVTITHTVARTENAEGGYTIDRHTETTIDGIEGGPETEFDGTLTVTGGWKNFALSITGDKEYEISGLLRRTRMSQMMCNQFKVSEEDTERVGRVDLQVVAKNFGARPGWGSYDGNMDFNCNYKIDIADLTTVAANVGST